MAESCICGRNKTFNQCCGRFLTAGQTAKTPEQLMRSRYSAYSLGGHGDYLLATWWPENVSLLTGEGLTGEGLTAAALSEKNLDWTGLEVLASTQTGDKATVEFKAHYRETGNPESHTMHEISTFLRKDGRWFYVNGEVQHQPS